MDNTPRAELFELYGTLLAGVSAIRRALGHTDDGSDPNGRGSPGQVASGPPVAPQDPDRAEVVASVERMRQAMLEALFVLDFVVVHRRLDSLMVRRVRTAVVGGIDSADACLAEEAVRGS